MPFTLILNKYMKFCYIPNAVELLIRRWLACWFSPLLNPLERFISPRISHLMLCSSSWEREKEVWMTAERSQTWRQMDHFETRAGRRATKCVRDWIKGTKSSGYCLLRLQHNFLISFEQCFFFLFNVLRSSPSSSYWTRIVFHHSPYQTTTTSTRTVHVACCRSSLLSKVSWISHELGLLSFFHFPFLVAVIIRF